MPEFIDREVERMRDSESSEPVTLLVGYDGDRDELKAEIDSLGGDVHEFLGRTTIAASVPKTSVDALCKFEGVLSVEVNDKNVKTLGEGNFERQTGSMM